MNTKTLTLSILSSAILMACSADRSAQVTTPQTKITPVATIEVQGSLHESKIMPVQKRSKDRALAAQAMTFSGAVMAQERAIHPIMPMPQHDIAVNNDQFASIDRSSIIQVTDQPVSTFSVDVDTGSYAIVRQYLNRGQLPPSDAVRVEEMVNYFDFDYGQPKSSDTPFSVNTQIMKTPWNNHSHLVQIGLQGYLPEQQRSPANLVFLMDVSGSMNAPNKLPLLKNAFKLLSKQLTEDDRISIVVYAGASGVVLKPTPGNERSAILTAINDLRAGGSTNGASGIKLAYQLAQQSYIENGINRVILATDGDFNVGTVNHDALIDLISKEKDKGIALTTLGFGHGNYNDKLMEQLADHGDGNYAFIDNLSEARKTLVGQISATLETIAKDVKIQIEWNPNQVAEYRLIGYENRTLNREDFNNDAVDAGEIGAGHTVTALYEVSLNSSQKRSIDPLRYQAEKALSKQPHSDEIAFIKLRYKDPKQGVNAASQLIQQVLTLKDNVESERVNFAAAVAAFAQKLAKGKYLNTYHYDDILKLARASKGNDHHGYRGEFIRLVELAQSLDS